MATNYDLLIYHDFSDTFDKSIAVGDSARVLGFEDLHVVALGPPLHGSKDRTIVLAHGARPMRKIQELLDLPREDESA
jgi:hypothetical protein